MNFELVFSLVNISVMPAWILLVFAPNWRFTDRIAHTALMPLLLALAYIYFLAWGIFFGGSADGAGMGSLAAVTTLFSSPVSLLGGWIHFLVFDLFVGAWIVRDGKRRNIGGLLRFPCLVFTFMFGPIGLAMYFVVRAFKGHGFTLNEA